MHNFRNLEIWKRSLNYSIEIIELSRSFPKDLRFELSSQINRCAISIPSNIAEGSSGKTDKDFARFLGISLGSAFELETQLLIAKKLNLAPDNYLDKKIEELNEIQKMIRAFKSKIE